ncbi:MAG: M56 family metallopeptidase [Clostridiales bacterium]|jgi:beta-lactamase regulating signal transducer with metallopeptidase domain|nr:M56 family metallopeptidase [Clostridiales bacterium]
MDIVQMSLSASVLIVAVAVIRALALHKLPKKAFLALWGVAVCRLLAPFSIPSRFSFYTGMDMARRILGERAAASFPAGTAGIPSMPGTGESLGMPAACISPIEIIWLAGMCACALFFIAAYIKCRREFRMSLPVENEFAAHWLQERLLRRPVQIRQSDRIKSPLTYGAFHPVILLPKATDWTDETKMRYILTHEITHIRRFDALAKLLLAASACVHWFNPFAWVMYALANRDIELSCDETVVRTFGETIKSAYALALIELEEKKSRLALLASNFSKNAIEERIVSIMKMKKTSLAGMLLAFVLVTGTSAAFATNAANRAPVGASESNIPLSDAGSSPAEKLNIKETYNMGSYQVFLEAENDSVKYYYDGSWVRCLYDENSPDAKIINSTAKSIIYFNALEDKDVLGKGTPVYLKVIRNKDTNKVEKLVEMSEDDAWGILNSADDSVIYIARTSSDKN